MDRTVKVGLIIGVVLVVLLVVPWLLGGLWPSSGGGWGMMGPGMMGGFGGGWFMPILFVLFWVLVIWGVVALIGGAGPSGGAESGSRAPDSALEVLKKRYARGEINKEEYEEKKRHLA